MYSLTKQYDSHSPNSMTGSVQTPRQAFTYDLWPHVRLVLHQEWQSMSALVVTPAPPPAISAGVSLKTFLPFPFDPPPSSPPPPPPLPRPHLSHPFSPTHLSSPLSSSGPCFGTIPSDVACWLAVAGLVKDVFESAAGQDAVGAVSDYLRTQRVTSLPDLQVCHTYNQLLQH